MLKLLTKLKTNDSGATAIEYGLIAALVAVAAIAALSAVGTELLNVFDGVNQDLGGTTVK